MSPRKPPAARTAAVIPLQLDEPLGAVRVDTDRYDEALLIARVGLEVVGQVFVPAKQRLEPAEIWAHLERVLAPQMRRAALRPLVRRALAAPQPAGGGADVSVIVCTRARPADLRRCLASLQELRAAAEIVVVDNAAVPSDARAACAEFSARYVHEPTPGQARARNSGINVARGELLAFTDDDCVVDPAWLDDLATDFADPAVGLVTGSICPLELETPAQYMFEAHGGFERGTTRRLWDPTSLSASEITGQVGAGANMIFRRQVLEEIRGFAEDLGPGTPVRSGDDKDAFYRVLRAGHRVLSSPARVVWHRHRDSPQALLQVFSDYGVSEFSYALRNLLRHRDLQALRVFRWWLKHFGREAWTHVARRPDRLPLRLLAAEIAGAIRAPVALWRSQRQRRSIPPVELATVTRKPQRAAAVIAEAPGAITMAVATRNRQGQLERLLRRLARQTLPPDRYEVLVVVDGSADRSAEMARGLDVPFELRVLEQEPSGLAVTRNRGAREARHPLVVFFDDDIHPCDDLLAAHLAAHRGARGQRVVLGPYPPSELPQHHWGRRQATWWRDHFRRKAEPDHVWTFIDYVDGNTSLEPRALAGIGGYDERFRGGRRQDWELGVRMLEAGWEFVDCPAAHGDHRFDARFETAARIGREEGRLDVMLVRTHPQIRRHLPVGWLASQVLHRSLVREGLGSRIFGRPGPWRHYLKLLERLGSVRAWNSIANRVLVRAYLRGIADAIPDAAERRSFLEWAAGTDGLEEPSIVDLDAGAGLDLPAIAPAALRARGNGAELGSHRVAVPSENWDWDAVVERLTYGIAEADPERLTAEWLLTRAEPAEAR